MDGGTGSCGSLRFADVHPRSSYLLFCESRQRESPKCWGGSPGGVWLPNGCQGRDVLECFSLPDILRHTWVCRGSRWSVCPARLVDQVHSPLEQWVVGESGLLHASSMDFSLAEAHDSLYAGWDQGSIGQHRTGLGWAGWYRTGSKRSRTRTNHQMNGRKFGACLSQRPWVASSELKPHQVAQETLFLQTPPPVPSRSGSKPVLSPNLRSPTCPPLSQL